MGMSITELAKALLSLEEAISFYKNSSHSAQKKAFRDACIQRFEYSIELSWKLSMKILGSQTSAAKPAIREMARNNLIADANRWIDFIEARNNTSHSYDDDVAKKVFSEIEAFLPDAQNLCKALEKITT